MTTKGHFSIGATRDEHTSPKLSRKDRTVAKSRPKRAISPAKLPQLPASTKASYSTTEPAKQAMSPSVAESLRAMFAAFLWHEGMLTYF